jgi:hypothetical protein
MQAIHIPRNRESKLGRLVRLVYDPDMAGTTFLTVHVGRGSGYLAKWYSDLNKGPGRATEPGQDCGHTGLDHCNSAYCKRPWCNVQGRPLAGLLVKGHTFRLWTGARWRAGLATWLEDSRTHYHALRLRQACHPYSNIYKLISAR